MNHYSILILNALIGIAHAGPRGSSTYQIVTDSIDSAGQRNASARYTNQGSLGGIAGIALSSQQTAKTGYIAQLTEATGLTVTANPSSVDEGNTVQLSAWQVLDDSSLITVPAASVAWSVSAPLIGVSTGGIATAGVVFQDTGATAQGSFAGFIGQSQIAVLNVNPDNFGIYAADSIDDDWQIKHFGDRNLNAGAGRDPDGDGQNNLFEFTAGLDPNNSRSRFIVMIAAVPNRATYKNIIFSPLIAGRNYTVRFKNSLTDPTWQPLVGSTESDADAERTVTDTNAIEAKKFYDVLIEKP